MTSLLQVSLSRRASAKPRTHRSPQRVAEDGVGGVDVGAGAAERGLRSAVAATICQLSDPVAQVRCEMNLGRFSHSVEPGMQ